MTSLCEPKRMFATQNFAYPHITGDVSSAVHAGVRENLQPTMIAGALQQEIALAFNYGIASWSATYRPPRELFS